MVDPVLMADPGTAALEGRATESCAGSGVISSGVEEWRSHSTPDR